jgi:hypothetical protein
MGWLTHQNPVKIALDIAAYWGFFWNILYVLAPPREYFNSPRYNKFLDLVSYYGSLNLRSVAMKAYGAAPADAPPIPKPASEQPPKGQ